MNIDRSYGQFVRDCKQERAQSKFRPPDAANTRKWYGTDRADNLSENHHFTDPHPFIYNTCTYFNNGKVKYRV